MLSTLQNFSHDSISYITLLVRILNYRDVTQSFVRHYSSIMSGTVYQILKKKGLFYFIL